jgi:hypothetical protein
MPQGQEFDAIARLSELLGKQDWVKESGSPEEVLEKALEWAYSMREQEVGHEQEMQRRAHAHAERMRALELGRPLDEGRSARAVGVAVPATTFGTAVGATALVLIFEVNNTLHLPLLGIVWGVAGVVSLAAVLLSLTVGVRRPAAPAQTPRDAGALAAQDVARHVQDLSGESRPSSL